MFTTAGSAAKLDFCRELGADVTINYRDEDFVERIAAETDGAGRRRDPGQHGRQVPGPQRRGARDRRPAGRRSACRAAPRPSSTWPADEQARLGARHHAAGAPATGHGGKAEIVAAVLHDVWPRRRARQHPPDRRPRGCRCPAPPRPTGWSRPASTSARSCSCPRTRSEPDAHQIASRRSRSARPPAPRRAGPPSSRGTWPALRRTPSSCRPGAGRRPGPRRRGGSSPPARHRRRRRRDGAVRRRIGGDRQVHRPGGRRVGGLGRAATPTTRPAADARAPRPATAAISSRPPGGTVGAPPAARRRRPPPRARTARVRAHRRRPPGRRRAPGRARRQGGELRGLRRAGGALAEVPLDLGPFGGVQGAEGVGADGDVRAGHGVTPRSARARLSARSA